MKKLLLVCILVSFLNTKGQVYNAGTSLNSYVDIMPDTLLNYVVAPYTHETFSVDLFGSTANDIELIAHGAVSSGGSAAYLSVTTLDPNVSVSFLRLDSVYSPGNMNWNVTKIAKPLNNGDQINHPSAIWESGQLYFTDHSGSGGGNKNVNDWIAASDKFIGLKYQSGTTTQYGWVRLMVTTEDSMYVKDYSASAPFSGIGEMKKNEPFIYPNPVRNSFFLKNADAYINYTSKIKIADAYSKEIKFTYEISKKDLRIDLDPDLPEGCYFLQVTTDNGIQFSKKIVKLE
jgi:hypothetical protein